MSLPDFSLYSKAETLQQFMRQITPEYVFSVDSCPEMQNVYIHNASISVVFIIVSVSPQNSCF